MAYKHARQWAFTFLLAMLLPAIGQAQSFRASVSGTVTDPTGAVVPNVQLTLTFVATGTSARATSGPEGLFSFPNLQPGIYELKASAPGFRDFVQRGIEVAIEAAGRVDVELALGAAVQTVEVTAAASPLNFESSEVAGGVTPSMLKELPLLVAGTVRSAASFATLMPGVTTGGGGNPFDARINGGLQTGDEAVMDGVSMQQGMMNQTGMISIYSDFPMTPDMVSELKVLTSSYAPEYGSTLSGQIVVESKAGGKEFHGGIYEYYRTTGLNARQWGKLNRVDEVTGQEVLGSARPKDVEHDLGGFLGGPFKLPGGRNIPWFNTGRKRSYFYLNLEGFRRAGGVVAPYLTVPTVRMKQGDFSEWVDADTGALIPIYDPATTRPLDPTQPLSATNVTRDQFMGCDPINNPQPNVICLDAINPTTGTRVRDSLAYQWLQYVPNPNRGGLLNNYAIPTPRQEVTVTTANYLMFRGDQYIGDADHVSLTIWYQGAPAYMQTELPPEIDSHDFTIPQFSFVDRIRWDHTFTPTLLNHFGFGYLDRNEGYGSLTWLLAPDALPRIGGAFTDDPPTVGLGDDYGQYGNTYGDNTPNRTTRQTYVFLDTLTWVKGKHTLKFGGEYRDLAQNIRSRIGGGGYFSFGTDQTGLIDVTSGHPVASFLLEAADYAEVTYRAIGARYPRSDYYIAHVGDTWKVTPKLSVNYGVRWDTMTPARELYDHHSFFDPSGPNPGAGGRPGRLAFAGTKDLLTGESWGEAGFGRRHPEETWRKGFAPRLGIAYSVTPKTVVRTGYGIFYTQAFYPGWESSIATDGLTATLALSSTLGGLQPAMILSQGFPIQQFIDQNKVPPAIDPSFRNGQDLQYKAFDANRRAYAQQWNLSIEHQFGENFTLNTAYVANKGTRLPAWLTPLNSLDPKLLSQYGEQLYDEFEEGQTELHGVPIPYGGWREQLSCSPSLAQALLPYPQYCSRLQSINENSANSIYHSFQLKAERRFAQGAYLLASYTLAKILGSADQTQSESLTWERVEGVISPFERRRNKGLAIEDVPQTLSLSLVYELPFGRGKRFLNTGTMVDKLVGGWTMSTLFRASSGTPFYFRSDTCNVPEQFRLSCLPAILPGANPWAQDKGNFDPNKPLFNINAFEPVSGFEAFGYYGQGPRISNLRGFGYHNQNIGFIKNTKITERINFQIRAEFFNVWNWHTFTCSNQCFGNTGFNIDIASPEFGMWNGTVSEPRNIQIAGRFEF